MLDFAIIERQAYQFFGTAGGKRKKKSKHRPTYPRHQPLSACRQDPDRTCRSV